MPNICHVTKETVTFYCQLATYALSLPSNGILDVPGTGDITVIESEFVLFVHKLRKYINSFILFNFNCNHFVYYFDIEIYTGLTM